MGREKRKGRLDKSTVPKKTEFIGFSAFAPAANNNHDAGSNNNNNNDRQRPLWSPVYTGSDETLQLLFPRISQKRDATTKVKALHELQSYMSKTLDDNDRVLRRSQLEALPHTAWLYVHKLHYDSAASVRAAALGVWQAATQRLPKAVTNLVTAKPEILGMWWVAQADPAANVRAAAAGVHNSSSTAWPWQEGLVQDYAARILSYGRASAMHQALVCQKEEECQTNRGTTRQVGGAV